MGSSKEYKPFSMSTTVRNIARVPELINVLIDLEKNNKNIYEVNNKFDPRSKDAKLNIIKEIIRGGFITSNRVDKDIRDKIKDGLKLSDNEVEKFLVQNTQKPGWAGRLSNYLNKVEPLGFAFRNSETQKIEVTELGKLFLSEPQKATIWSIANITSNYFFSRRKNKITPLGVVAQYFKKYDKKHISKKKLATLLSLNHYKDFDTINFNEIKNMDVAMHITTANLKESTFYDYENEFGMTMIFAGLFKRGFNGYEPTKLLLSNLNVYIQKQIDAVENNEHIFTIDQFRDFVNSAILEDVVPDEDEPNHIKIKRIAQKYKYDELKNYILMVGRREHIDLPNIDHELKTFVLIEWLFALILAKKENFKVSPNLSLDFDGYPISQAPGGNADINVLRDNKEKINMEITLLTSAKQQENSETTSIVRHALADNVSRLYLLAPRIHDDILDYFDYKQNKHKIDINALSFQDFIDNEVYLDI